eukprot:2324083-Prymnesium_polylepis.1
MGGGAVEEYTLPRTPTGASAVRGSICMHVYALAFGWVVEQVNTFISYQGGAEKACIGLLDIF